MKFLPIALVTGLFLAAPPGLMPAHADGPIEVTSPAGDDYLFLTPARHDTDGFFVALFERRPNAGEPNPS